MGEVAVVRRVLFVDDDPVIGRAFRRTVSTIQLEADIASSAVEALTLTQAHAYPIVVTDMRMPDIDGLELVELLTRQNPQTTFVLITADRDLRLRANRHIDGRIVSILSKPWDSDELFATLKRALDLHDRRVTSLVPGVARASEDPGLQLLLVEDNPGDALLFMRQLLSQGVIVTHTTRLREAIALLRQRTFDVIVTDLSLPDARGLDAVMRLQEAAPDATVVVLTGVDDEALSLQIVECGAQDCLLKGRVDGPGLVRSLRQARERKRCSLRLADLASTDSVTGLANRSGFNQRLDQALSRARREDGRLAVMVLDLDGFKAVNDRFGHSAGDELLKLVGARLSGVVRDDEMVARLGGDEFALLVEDTGTQGDPTECAEHVIEALAQPVLLGSVSHELTASMGVAIFPDSGTSAERLLRAADQAMYVAKRRGRNRFHIYAADDHAVESVLPPAR
jgi:two-component system cell cycle response regulator